MFVQREEEKKKRMRRRKEGKKAGEEGQKRDQETIPWGACKDRYQNQYRGKTNCILYVGREGRRRRRGERKKGRNIEKNLPIPFKGLSLLKILKELIWAIYCIPISALKPQEH